MEYMLLVRRNNIYCKNVTFTRSRFTFISQDYYNKLQATIKRHI